MIKVVPDNQNRYLVYDGTTLLAIFFDQDDAFDYENYLLSQTYEVVELQ